MRSRISVNICGSVITTWKAGAFPVNGFGEGARQLGLSGVTNEKDFVNLCRNLHPQTGEQLTPRMNSKRVSVDKNGNVHESANRRVFYDFTLSPPKSVSIAALVGNDKRIIEAHDEAVRWPCANCKLTPPHGFGHKASIRNGRRAMWWARSSGMTRHAH